MKAIHYLSYLLNYIVLKFDKLLQAFATTILALNRLIKLIYCKKLSPYIETINGDFSSLMETTSEV